MKTIPFSQKITPKNVAQLINFNPEGASEEWESMHIIQTEGVAGIWNILGQQGFAYLADEVGMGKTYQALGIISLLWNFKPDAKVVIVCPRVNLQNKWQRDYRNFIMNNYRAKLENQGDDRVKSILLNTAIINPCVCHNLRSFAAEINTTEKQMYILRHSSFMRPVFINEEDYRKPLITWYREVEKMQRWGLHPDKQNKRTIKNIEDISWQFNEWFAQAFNKMLTGLEHDDGKLIDLLIVDEAQYLRNKNQTNNVLHNLFKDHVDKWLFLSATPIHSGRENIQRVINDYVKPDFITDEVLENVDRLRDKMKIFTIRRPREYYVKKSKDDKFWPKYRYRSHKLDESKITKMSPLESLVMAIVQKKLVAILDNKNNRYKIGCLLSFESLQASVYNKEKIKRSLLRDDNEPASVDEYSESSDRISDIYLQNDSDSKEVAKDVPDKDFVSTFAKRYYDFFQTEIPHPKVDFVVKQIADRSLNYGDKYVIFTRRINPVSEITRRLNQEYDNWLRKHISDAWNRNIDEFSKVEDTEENEMVTDDVDTEDDNTAESGLLFTANQKGKWLFRYRQTFRESGRNVLMFEENWFRYFSEVNNIPLESIPPQIPDDLWAESRAFANRQGINQKAKVLPADRYQYLLVQVLKRYPNIIGFDAKTSLPWLSFFSKRYPNAFQNVKRDNSKNRAENLITFKGFWDVIREKMPNETNVQSTFGKLNKLMNIHNEKSLFKREIAKNCIWQAIRLTDILVDLRCADDSCDKNADIAYVCERFIDFLLTNNQSELIRKQIKEWLESIEIIIANCFSNEEYELSNLASRESYTELRNPRFAVGMTGGNPNKTALSQFKTPGYPRVIVCTDILKEGEDLHVFCDQIVHYGIAWTSGDLEQRVGRVDRYFSLIERRLSLSNEPENEKLNIFYPHIVNSLEKYQIEKVLNRVKDTEQILDDMGLSKTNESKDVDLNLDYSNSISNNQRLLDRVKHFEPKFDGIEDYNMPICQNIEIENHKDRYHTIYNDIVDYLKTNGYIVEISAKRLFTEPIHIMKDALNFDCHWEFVPHIDKYAFRINHTIDKNDLQKSKYPICEYRQLIKKEYRYIRSHRVFIDASVEHSNIFHSVDSAFRLLQNTDKLSSRDDKSIKRFVDILKEKGHNVVITDVTENACKIYFKFKNRSHNCKIRTYNDLTLISSIVGKITHFYESPKFWDNNDNWSRAKFNEWTYDENYRLKYGYLSIKENELRFSERVFSAGLSDETIIKLMEKLAQISDGYEMQILGEDLL